MLIKNLPGQIQNLTYPSQILSFHCLPFYFHRFMSHIPIASSTPITPSASSQSRSKTPTRNSSSLFKINVYQKVKSFGLLVVFLGSESSRKWCVSYKIWFWNLGWSHDSSDDTIAFLYSSGTIGVILSHHNFISVSQMVVSAQRLMGERGYVFLDGEREMEKKRQVF